LSTLYLIGSLSKLIISIPQLKFSIIMKKKINQNFLYKKNLLQQIRGFCYAVRCNGISEASRIMNLTQSTVTLQIQSLERDLGFSLFKRDTKPLSLTSDGKEFYKIACPLMHEFESVIEKFLTTKKEKEKKQIDIAVHHIAISYLMPKIISAFKKHNPDTEIVIRNISPDDALKRLKEGKIDLAFYPNLPNDPEVKKIDVMSYDPILIMNKHHPLAKKSISSLSDLKEFDLIRIDQNLITLPLFEEVVKTYGIKGSVEFENGNWEILKQFVKENNFAAVVSTICINKSDSDLIQINLTKFFPKMLYGIGIRSGQISDSLTQNFILAIKAILKIL
jgi:DNA-binding transcriptional LysR family regulator